MARKTNKEVVLQNKIILRPDIIESDLKLIERETRIEKTKKRCDCLFLDQNSRKLFVEVKEQIDDKAIKQITEYRDLVGSTDSRFMLFSNDPIDPIIEEKLKEIKIEYRSKNKDDITIKLDSIVQIPKGGSPYRTRENVFKVLGNEEQIARNIYTYVESLFKPEDPLICNISDGIMFHLVERKIKFLTITTIGNRLLFHVPVNRRDQLLEHYRDVRKIKVYHPNPKPKQRHKNKNQIDILLKDINSESWDSIVDIINIAYEDR